MQRLSMLLGLLALITPPSLAQTTEWILDKAHSSVSFSVSHLLISEVSGKFDEFEIRITADKPDFTDAKISVAVKIASINTGVEKRDQHLRSDDFFNAEQFPEMTFTGKKIEKIDGSKYKLHGDLTIRDVTKPVILDVVFGGIVDDPWGNTVAGFSISGEVNRFDYGLKWNTLTKAGALVAGEKITIKCNVEARKKK